MMLVWRTRGSASPRRQRQLTHSDMTVLTQQPHQEEQQSLWLLLFCVYWAIHAPENWLKIVFWLIQSVSRIDRQTRGAGEEEQKQYSERRKKVGSKKGKVICKCDWLKISSFFRPFSFRCLTFNNQRLCDLIVSEWTNCTYYIKICDQFQDGQSSEEKFDGSLHRASQRGVTYGWWSHWAGGAWRRGRKHLFGGFQRPSNTSWRRLGLDGGLCILHDPCRGYEKLI